MDTRTNTSAANLDQAMELAHPSQTGVDGDPAPLSPPQHPAVAAHRRDSTPQRAPMTRSHANRHPLGPASGALLPPLRRELTTDITPIVNHSYENLSRLGQGSYGTVYKARCKRTQEIVVLKKLRSATAVLASAASAATGKPAAKRQRKDKKEDAASFPVTSIREIKILSTLDHPNIIGFREVLVSRDGRSVFIALDYCDFDLGQAVDAAATPFGESQVKAILLQVLRGVAYMHDNFIIHRDIKPPNILMTEAGDVLIADFGLARTMERPLGVYTPRVATLWCRAPELLLGVEKYHTAIDMWAVGCFFGELMQRAPLLPGKTDIEQLDLIYALLGVPNERIWPGFEVIASKSQLLASVSTPLSTNPYNNLSHLFPSMSDNGINLMSRLLTYDPSKRISAHKALDHPYFAERPLPCAKAELGKRCRSIFAQQRKEAAALAAGAALVGRKRRRESNFGAAFE